MISSANNASTYCVSASDIWCVLVAESLILNGGGVEVSFVYKRVL